MFTLNKDQKRLNLRLLQFGSIVIKLQRDGEWVTLSRDEAVMLYKDRYKKRKKEAQRKLFGKYGKYGITRGGGEI